MDDIFIKIFTSFGTGGVVAWLMWLLMKKNLADAAEDRKALREANGVIVMQLNDRIKILEEHSRKCDEDRTKLWERLLTKDNHPGDA